MNGCTTSTDDYTTQVIKTVIFSFKGRSIGQNGQILFISGEQLSLNVAGDSAKTLSVLGNMGGVLDDCGLRFVQMRRRPPKNTPDFGGPSDCFEKLPKKDPYRNHTKSMN